LPDTSVSSNGNFSGFVDSLGSDEGPDRLLFYVAYKDVARLLRELEIPESELSSFSSSRRAAAGSLIRYLARLGCGPTCMVKAVAGSAVKRSSSVRSSPIATTTV
jgi:hypothetical protein